MRRREFITVVGGAAVAWPQTARAQPVERRRHIILGKYYGRVGTPIVVVAALVFALAASLIFSGSFVAALIAMLLWDIGYATRDMLLKAIIAGQL